MELGERFDLVYTKVKAHLWVPFLLPLLILVATEYLRIVLWIFQIGVCAFIVVQGVGFVIGMWARVMSDFGKKTYWDELEDLKICKAIPTIRLGMKCFDWAMTNEVQEEQEAQVRAARDAEGAQIVNTETEHRHDL